MCGNYWFKENSQLSVGLDYLPFDLVFSSLCLSLEWRYEVIQAKYTKVFKRVALLPPEISSIDIFICSFLQVESIYDKWDDNSVSSYTVDTNVKTLIGTITRFTGDSGHINQTTSFSMRVVCKGNLYISLDSFIFLNYSFRFQMVCWFKYR